MKIKFDVTAEEFKIIQTILNQHLPETCKVWVFGSRAKNTARHNSDLDLALEYKEKLNSEIISKLKEAFNDAPIAFSIDIVDMLGIEDYFREIIEQQKVLFPLSSRVPELRFPDFNEPWNHGKLGNLINSLDAGISVNSGDRPTSNNENGILKTSCVSNGPFDPNENKLVDAPEEVIRLKEPVLANTIIISRMNTPALVGANSFIDKDYSNLFLPDRLWAGKISENHSPTWVGFLTAHPSTRAIFTARGTGTSGSMKNITKGDVLTTPVSYPLKTEQQKIANFLSSVDNKISLLTEKQNLLQRYKKGVMQKLFPSTCFDKAQHERSGQVPELRFKDDQGNDFPDWEDKKLHDISNFIKSGKDKPTEKGGYPVYGSTGQLGLSETHAFEGKHLLIARVGANAGRINTVKHKFGVTDNTLVMKLGNNISTDFIYSTLIKFNLNRLVFGSGQPLITGGMLKALKIQLPCFSEQQKIANFLNEIDKKIYSVNQQMEQTKTFKKGLLQKMFV